MNSKEVLLVPYFFWKKQGFMYVIRGNDGDSYKNITIKRWIWAASNFIAFYPSHFNLSDVGKFFWSWILKDCIEVLEKNCVPILNKSWNKAFSRCSGRKEMYKKTLMHVQSRCFANLNLLLFCCSCWSCHHCCLSSLLAGGNPQPPALSDSPERVLTFSIIRIRLFPRVLAIIPRGGTRDFKWQGWSKDFFGFEIFDSGIFLGTKIWLG